MDVCIHHGGCKVALAEANKLPHTRGDIGHPDKGVIFSANGPSVPSYMQHPQLGTDSDAPVVLRTSHLGMCQTNDGQLRFYRAVRNNLKTKWTELGVAGKDKPEDVFDFPGTFEFNREGY